MNDAAVVALSPETVLGEMKKNGVTHVVWLPDSETNWLYLLMKADPAIHLVGVNREGHASSIAAGLWLGGAKPACPPIAGSPTAKSRFGRVVRSVQ